MSTKMLIWKQGAAFQQLGKKIIEVNHKIHPGPSDERVRVAGFEVLPDKAGNFIHGNGERAYSEDELDAIHTFGVVRYIIDMYEKMLDMPIPWSWERDGFSAPLTVNIRNNNIYARFNKTTRTIDLDFYGPYENWTYYCRSVDIVAHETGHALLDALKPEWENGNIETFGLAEAFCDLTAMFMVTSQFDLCEVVMKETGGDLKNQSILSEFGVGYNLENGNGAIRSAINTQRFRHNFQFSYDYAAVVVGCLYDILCDIIAHAANGAAINTDVLFNCAQKWQSAIVNTYEHCSARNSNLRQFHDLFASFMDDHKDLVTKHFRKRNIPV
jgi:hypothetical protein